jgi:hypothetical protein
VIIFHFNHELEGGFETFKFDKFHNLSHYNQGVIESLKLKIMKQKKSVLIPEHCQAQNFKLLENVELPDHNS